MRGDQVSKGDTVTYRGKPAKVLDAWRTVGKAPKGIRHPVGVVLELGPDHTIWLGWPCNTAEEASRSGVDGSIFPRHDDDDATKKRKAKALNARVKADLEAFPIEAL
jgi:hypothetical protein